MEWEQQAVIRLSPDFDVTSHAECRRAVLAWLAQQSMEAKMKIGRSAGEHVAVYAYCQTHKDCPRKWRHIFQLTEDGAKEHIVHVNGNHATEPRLVRGTAVAVRRQADALTEANTPMQAMVQLAAQGAEMETWPCTAALVQSRRRAVRKKSASAEFGGGTGLGQWLEHLRKINEDGSVWSTVVREDGCGIVTCQKFADAAAAMIAQARGGDHDYLVGVHDCTYKVFSSDWGLWKFCLCAKKYDREGIPRTTLVQVGLGFVPKEGQEHMLTVLHLMKEWHSSKNNDLSQFLHQVHADESLGGQNALRKAFPKTVFVLDVRHQVSSIMRRAGSKKEVRAMVAANMQFALSALGFSRPLFSLYIDSLLVRLVELGELDLAAYLQKDVVEKVTVEGKEMWTSACCCFISLLGTSVKFQSHEANPGMTSTTISQSLEASWHHMKKLLPGNVAKMPATDALNHILKATEAWDCAKGSALKLKLGGLSSRLVSGEAIFTERVKVLDDHQMRLPCARLLWQSCPGNTKSFEFDIGEVGDVRQAFVLPVTNASMVVDDDVACCMVSLLRLCDSSVQKHLEKSPGMWHEEAGRLSLTKVKEILANVCVVTLVAGPEEVLDRLRCSCLYFAKTSRCSHMAFAAFLLGHHNDYFQDLIDFTRKDAPKQPPSACVKLTRKKYSRAAIPSAAAWKRMATICAEASEKYNKRRKTDKGEAQAAMETTPTKQELAAGKNKDPRALSLETIRDKLGAKDFHSNFSGMHLCIKHAVTVQEAKEHGLGKMILGLKHKTTSAPTKALANQLLQAWVVETRASASSAKSSS
ncbi:unnamed protein product [Effrenium voratum]|uniref:SWIM-type domain-containing protein n=1 Tax=Effrenium voratum TaxID=2562239 RepID=A0AA36N7H6_9DINO|nr:unnamed protein product [Effrenium voratum]